MYTQTEGIVLRQTKTSNGRRMIELLSKNYGKIGAGTSINEGGKSKTALALRPFTYANYEIYKNRDSYNISGAQTIKSFYSIGEDVDKYMAACTALELTDKVLQEEQTAPGHFMLLISFLENLEKRPGQFGTLVAAFELKLLALEGLKASSGLESDSLNLDINADIIQMLRFMENHKLKELENLALNPDMEMKIKEILRVYFAHHLGIGELKSEALIL